MTDFQQHALQLAAQQRYPEWLSGFRSVAAGVWQSTPWPTRKTEAWKYNSLSALQKQTASAWCTELADWKNSVSLIDVDATRLVFVNGVFDATSSSRFSPEIIRFSEANEAQKEIIQQHLGRVITGNQHLFAALNNTWTDDGVLIHVSANQLLTKPIYIVQVATAEAIKSVVNQRLLVVLEKGARAEVIEHFVSTPDMQSTFVNALSEFVVSDNAELHHYRLNNEEETLEHIGAVHVDLYRHARMRGFTLAMGGKLKRIDYQINHRGQGAELDLQGLYLPRNTQTVDYHTNVQHWVPQCRTNEVFRGIVADAAQAIFNGRIYIHKDAQKTLAELSNKNLLTSNKAEVNTKPELEIYADDVKCAHGATISQLNDTALYYLQSRGISRVDAEVMLSVGFINELLQQIAQPSVLNYLMPLLGGLFGRNHALLNEMY